MKDKEARASQLPAYLHHAALWHLIDGIGGAVSVPDFKKLPASKYVMMFQNEDGTVELVANDEKPTHHFEPFFAGAERCHDCNESRDHENHQEAHDVR